MGLGALFDNTHWERHFRLKRKVVVAPHRKAKQVRSNKQTLSEIANGLKALAENSRKYNKMMIEEERKLEERYLSFQREEVEKNR